MNSLDQLSEPLRHAITQSIAAERLEGWQPAEDEVAELVRLARDELTFGAYLAARRALHPPPAPPVHSPRRLFRRHRPYVLPGTTLLRNNFGAESQEMLSDLEFVSTAGRILQWHRLLTEKPPGPDSLDARMLHQHIFADVYPWAGNYRSTELQRQDTYFVWRSMVAAATADVEHQARTIADPRNTTDNAELAYQLAGLYADYNHIHPFREGNGRTGTLLLHTVAALRGVRLDLSRIDRQEWYQASRDSAPFRRDGRANHRPFIPLMVRALG